MKIITKEEFSRATKLNKVYMPGLASILMEVMKINEVNKVFQKAKHLSGISFIDKILQVIGIKVEFDEKEETILKSFRSMSTLSFSIFTI